MRRQGQAHCTRDILSSLIFFPLDYYCKRFCLFHGDAIMTHQHTPRGKSVVALTTICVIFIVLCCNLPHVESLGSECYTISGLDYRGHQDKIGLPPDAGELLKYTTCLSWNSSIEFRKPRAREKGIGNHSYCRNPDNDIMPWCKIGSIEGSDGAWGYCHLPKCEVPGYLGCFTDRGTPSALDGAVIIHKDMTVRSCIEFCFKNGFEFAGLEAGHVCYCGNGGYDRYGKSSERGTRCAHKCFGNKGQPCGGDGFVDVYRTEIGSCGLSATMRLAAGAIYSPGYPDYPGSSDMMTSIGATESMLRRYSDDLKRDNKDASKVEELIEAPPKNPGDTCVWNVEIKKATVINMLVRKIDPRLKLGGIIELEAAEGSSFVLTRSHEPSVTSQLLWIVESNEARHDLEVIVPPEGMLNNTHTRHKSKWSPDFVEKEWRRYALPPRSLDPVLSVNGEGFTVKFVKQPEMIAALRNVLDFPKHRRKSRRRSGEWSRFIVEYEATFPEGVIYDPRDVDVIESSSDVTARVDSRKRPRQDRRHPQPEQTEIVDVLRLSRFTISTEDAKKIQEAVAGSNGDSTGKNGSNYPIKIEVFVENVDQSGSADRKPMSDTTTQTLLYVVLAVTLSILVLFAVLLLYRRRIFPKKNEKCPSERGYSRGLVVDIPRDGDAEKSGSNSNLSSSSTAESVLLTDVETRYSPSQARRTPPPVNQATINDLVAFLKKQSGLSQSPLDIDQHKQMSSRAMYGVGGDSRYVDVAPLPGPCAHCCECADETRSHRHGDSCRTHHSQVKHPRPQIACSGRAKNPRGLSIRSSKQVAPPSLAPPLSPISEVSSVTSSMVSLPSATSQTSLLQQKLSQKQVKKDNSKFSESFLTSESETESMGDDKDSKSEVPTDKTTSKDNSVDKKGVVPLKNRYLGAAVSACYDSGYATSNYEEEEIIQLSKPNGVADDVIAPDIIMDS